MNILSHNLLHTSKIIILALLLAFGLSYAHAAWSPPSASPPSDNTPAPLNVGSVQQDKNGNLRVLGFRSFYDALLATDGGNVGIGTLSPTAKLDVEDNISSLYEEGVLNANEALLRLYNSNSSSNTHATLLFEKETPDGPVGAWISNIGYWFGGAPYYSKLSFGLTNPDPELSGEMLTITPTGVGVGISEPNARLDVNGRIRIRGGSPGAGKVLTSDAVGIASWQVPPSFGFGSWTTRSPSTVYQAASDGFVIAELPDGFASESTPGCFFDGVSDSSSAPTTVRAHMNLLVFDPELGIYPSDSMTFPVRKNDYWAVVDGGSEGFGSCGGVADPLISVYWLPLQ